MCIFSQSVNDVSKTSIYARSRSGRRQALVYSMTLDIDSDLAMILPIPVREADEDSVTFINLEDYPDFFEDMDKGFPEPVSRGFSKGLKSKSATLKVVEVGSYEASFVPQIKDFARLDERFRLPIETWDKLPQYKEFGFAVFKLRKGTSKVHPMAFVFSCANKKLFFPTVHIHDGKVHDKADFDHKLYCQLDAQDTQSTKGWTESDGFARGFMDLTKACGLVTGNSPIYRLRMKGKLKNEDTYL